MENFMHIGQKQYAQDKLSSGRDVLVFPNLTMQWYALLGMFVLAVGRMGSEKNAEGQRTKRSENPASTRVHMF